MMRRLRMSEIAIDARGLRKVFGEKVAVADLSLQVGKGEVFQQCDFTQPLALIIGGEAEGASETAHKVADSLIHIPMPGGGESLNAAVSAGILLFEIARQRGKSK